MVTRRVFMQFSALAAAGMIDARHEAVSAEPAPETKRLRIAQFAYCYAPQYMAEDLLRAEGFSELQYVRVPDNLYYALAKGEIDLTMAFSSGHLLQVDTGAPIVMLAGMHPGCLELVA